MTTDPTDGTTLPMTRRQVMIGSSALLLPSIASVIHGQTPSGNVEVTTDATIPMGTSAEFIVHEDSSPTSAQSIDDGENTYEFSALEGSTDDPLEYQLEITLESNEAQDETPEVHSMEISVPGPPTETDATAVFATSSNGVVKAFDPDDGSTIWTDHGVSSDSRAIDYLDGEGLVVVGYNNGDVRALDVDDGEQVWEYTQQHSTVNVIRASPSSELFLGTQNGVIYRLGSNGSVIDSHAHLGASRSIYGMEIHPSGDTLFVTDDDGLTTWYSLPDFGVPFSLSSGEDGPLISNQLGISPSGDTIYVPSASQDEEPIIAYDTSDGSEEWVSDANNNVTYALAATDSEVYGIDQASFWEYDASDGSTLSDSSISSPGEQWTDIAIHGGLAYAGLRNGRVAVIDITDGVDEIDTFVDFDVTMGDLVRVAPTVSTEPVAVEPPDDPIRPDEPQGIDALWDNHLVWIVMAVFASGSIGLASKSMTIGAFGATLVFTYIAITTGEPVLTNVLTVAIVMIFIGFSFKLWRFEGGGE